MTQTDIWSFNGLILSFSFMFFIFTTLIFFLDFSALRSSITYLKTIIN